MYLTPVIFKQVNTIPYRLNNKTSKTIIEIDRVDEIVHIYQGFQKNGYEIDLQNGVNRIVINFHPDEEEIKHILKTMVPLMIHTDTLEEEEDFLKDTYYQIDELDNKYILWDLEEYWGFENSYDEALTMAEKYSKEDLYEKLTGTTDADYPNSENIVFYNVNKFIDNLYSK